MEYAIKQTAFLDILGFGTLVDNSANSPNLTQTIFDVLSSIDSGKVHTDAFMQLNKEIIPPEELEEAIRIQKLAAEGMHQQWPIDVAYFSDSLVLSAENSNACYNVLELIASLIIRIWADYGLLIRGGIAIDKLIHVKNGPIFGPAMNCAYYLESKHAKHPRVIIEPTAFETLKKVDLYVNMSRLFSNDGDYVSINLASAYDHLINKSTLALAPGMHDTYIRSLLATTAKLVDKIEEFDPADEKIRPKYVWIKDKIDELIANEEQTFLKAYIKAQESGTQQNS